MRKLAELIMRGRTQAILVAVIAAMLPLLYWLSAAAVGLVTLRRGPSAGTGLLVWSLLPAGAWALNGDPTPLTVIVGTFVLAVVLRRTVSWQQTLTVLLPVGVVAGIGLELMLGDMLDQLVQVTREMTADSPQTLQGIELDADWWHQLYAGGLGAAHAAMMLGSLVLARWWQSTLYNPGGFRQEFHQLRLKPALALLIMAVLALGPQLGLDPVRWLPLLLMPLAFAGLALVHGSVAKRELGGTWLFMFYMAVVILGPYVITLLVLLAVVDSLVDIRRRIPAKT
ncbi:hypothetical protein [Marinobacterium aestuariivivens]|uniref:DUF2232 domain-containing protein n=1 Tax=Marinobacterium aestuariivivens TaxID=1698799 RepID=A0ABW1ZWX8_9GAMM